MVQPPAAVPGDPPPDDALRLSTPEQKSDLPKQETSAMVDQKYLASQLESDESILSELSSSESELSSVGTMSPPPGYLSPVSSQSHDSATVDSIDSIDRSKSKKPRKRIHREDETPEGKNGDGPARKKRRSPEPKPRTRRNLDVRIAQNIAEQEDELATLLKVLRKRRKIVIVAGAGISVSAGIPDFRSSTGLFKSLKSEHKLKGSGKSLFDASVYSTDSSTSSFHDMVRNMSSLVNSAKPTPFHRMVERLSGEGRLMRLYTQNVDGIDVSMPSLATQIPLPVKGPWPKSVQLHGGLEKMVCTKCHQLSDFQPDLFSGPAPPPCKRCIEADRVRTDHAGKRSHGVGRLRPRMVLYNEHNPDEEAIGSCMAADLRTRPDALIVVGTSMKIPGVKRIVKEMCGVIRSRRDGLTIWMNHDDPPPGKDFEDVWDLVVKGPCDEVARQWSIADQQSKECSDSDIEKVKARVGSISIVAPPSPSKKAIQLVTPAATPKQDPVDEPKPVPKLKLSQPKPPTESQPADSRAVPGKAVQTAAKKLATAKKANHSGLKAAKAAKQSTAKGAKKAKKNTNLASTAALDAAGIQSHFQVSKSGVKTASKASKATKENEAAEPLSPANDRINRTIKVDIPGDHKSVEHQIHPDIKTPLRVEVPPKAASISSSRRSSMEIVSPTSVPRGMADLLA